MTLCAFARLPNYNLLLPVFHGNFASGPAALGFSILKIPVYFSRYRPYHRKNHLKIFILILYIQIDVWKGCQDKITRIWSNYQLNITFKKKLGSKWPSRQGGITSRTLSLVRFLVTGNFIHWTFSASSEKELSSPHSGALLIPQLRFAPHKICQSGGRIGAVGHLPPDQ